MSIEYDRDLLDEQAADIQKLEAEIERLRAALKDIVLLDEKRLLGRQKFDHAFRLAQRALADEQSAGDGK